MALALAGCAGLSLALGDAIWFDAVVGLSWIAGWTLLDWATIVGAAVAVRRRSASIEVVLVVATAAVIAGVIWAHPLLGSGAGRGVAVTGVAATRRPGRRTGSTGRRPRE